jgi:hypothetical protein
LFNLSIGDSGRDLRLIQQLAYLAVVVFTGMRAIDIYNCRSANISAVDATRIPGKVLSRYYKFQLMHLRMILMELALFSLIIIGRFLICFL